MKVVVFVILSMLDFSCAVIYRLNDSDHGLMPPLVRLDRYESCLQQPTGFYCTAAINFVSDEPSALLTQMQEYSQYTIRHFNYTRALYGTCVSNKCASEKQSDPKRTLEACLNRTIWNEYKLKVKLEDGLYCVDGSKSKISLDVAGMVMVAVCVALVMLNVVGSLYDYYLLKHKHDKVAYFLLCFSLRRNWRDLVSSSDNSKDPREGRLQGIHGIRAMSMIVVVLAHSMMCPLLFTDNTLFYEKQYDILANHVLINGSLIMQTFLILSAFLLVYNSLKAEEKYETNWTLLPKKILQRWLRLTPSYALVLGVTATWLDYVGAGPFWDILVSTESRACRRDWWRHILYINNYFDDSKCMPQAWYSAADFQLYILGMTVYVLCKNPKSRKVVLSILFLIGIVLPGLHTYFQDLDAYIIITPSGVISIFENYPTFHHVYKRGHTNVPGYILGLTLGYFIYALQKNKFEQKYKKWVPVYWAMVPVAVGIFLLCKFFYIEGPRMDVAWRAVISSFIRPAFGITGAVIVAGTILKIENVYRGILEWRGWTTLAKVSYSVYLVHAAFVRTLGAMNDTTVPGAYSSILQNGLFSLVVIYPAAYVFYLSVEAPLNKLVKLYLEPTRKKIE